MGNRDFYNFVAGLIIATAGVDLVDSGAPWWIVAVIVVAAFTARALINEAIKKRQERVFLRSVQGWTVQWNAALGDQATPRDEVPVSE